jgi:hypothetical protein
MHFLYLSSDIAARMNLITVFLRNNVAYLDPGSGSYLLQLLIAGLLGGFFVVRSSWDKIKSFFRKLFSREEEEEPTDEE